MQKDADSSSSATEYIWQTLENPARFIGKTLTVAAMLKGSNCRIYFRGVDTDPPDYRPIPDWTVFIHSVTVPADVASIQVVIHAPNGEDWQCRWIAVYEGEYTAETLPEYRPKGYGVELAECLRYFERLKGTTFGSKVYLPSGASKTVCTVMYTPKRLEHPSIQIVNKYYLILGMYSLKDQSRMGHLAVSDITGYGQPSQANLTVTLNSSPTTNYFGSLDTMDGDAPYIDISCDL